MKTITFIRHGQSTANAGGITMTHDAIPLSEWGIRQAKADTFKLQPSAIYVSEFVRTHETAKPFCEKLSMSVTVQPLRNELSILR